VRVIAAVAVVVVKVKALVNVAVVGDAIFDIIYGVVIFIFVKAIAVVVKK